MDESTVRHGDAWRYFAAECRERGVTSQQMIEEIWPWFLAGWLAKAKQRDVLREKK